MTWKNEKRRRNRILILALLMSVFYYGLFPLHVFSGDILEGAIPLQEGELEETRGGYAGFFLTVDYSRDIINTSVTPVGGEETFPPGKDGPPDRHPGKNVSDAAQQGEVKIIAQVGELNGISGILQIIQVPGSNNIVNAVMNVEMTIIHVMSEDAAARIVAIMSDLYGVP